MKFSDLTFKGEEPIVTMTPRLLRLPDAVRYVGAEAMLQELEEHGGLKPYRQRKRLTLYDRLEIDKAIERIRDRESDQ